MILQYLVICKSEKLRNGTYFHADRADRTQLFTPRF